MYGVFINEDDIPFATLIAQGSKDLETRTKDMLGKLFGERVALVSTSKSREPLIVGYATIKAKDFVPYFTLDTIDFRQRTCIPKGSKYDMCAYNRAKGIYGKWCYLMKDPETCYPKSLPENVTYHGRSYCEFN